MENNLEYIQVCCGYISYLIVRSGDRFSVVYVEPMKSSKTFARTQTLRLAYDMVKAHLRGKHQCAFKLSELVDCSTSIRVGNFTGVKFV